MYVNAHDRAFVFSPFLFRACARADTTHICAPRSGAKRTKAVERTINKRGNASSSSRAPYISIVSSSHFDNLYFENTTRE